MSVCGITITLAGLAASRLLKIVFFISETFLCERWGRWGGPSLIVYDKCNASNNWSVITPGSLDHTGCSLSTTATVRLEAKHSSWFLFPVILYSNTVQQVINDGNNLGHQECLNDQKIEILIQLSANITRHHGGCCVINLKKSFL